MIGTSGQPPFVRDGRIVRLIDVLSEQTGYSVALTSMVGLDSQIVQWRHGPTGLACTRELSGGVKDPIHHSAAGWMMLSTFEPRRVEAMLRRLNAEAPDTGKFQIAEMMNRISECGERRYVVGPVGFNTDTRGFSVLVPRQPNGRPMAMSLVYGKDDFVSTAGLFEMVSKAMRTCLPDPEPPMFLDILSCAA